MKRLNAMRGWLPWLGFAAFGVAACQVVVGETELTTVNCRAEGAVGPPACAVGQVCLNGVCVSESSAADGGGGTSGTGGVGGSGGAGGTGGGGTGGGGTGGVAGNPDAGDASDTGFDAPDDSVVPEVGPDVPTDTPVDSPPDVAPDAPLLAVGAACDNAAQCQTKRCYQAGSNKRCTSLCCSSFECAAGTVCVPYSGMNICLPPADLGMPDAGTAAQGQACAHGSACRSSRCSTTGTCLDVCCTNGNCNDNAACAWQNWSGTSNWYCGSHSVGSSSAHYATCSSDATCDGRNCYDYNVNVRCMGPCCSDADCAESVFDGSCDYLSDNGAVIRQCFPSTVPSSGAAKACCSDANCPSGQRCVPTLDEAWTTDILDPKKDVWGMRCQ